MQVNWAAQKRIIKHNSVYCAHASVSVRERDRERERERERERAY